MYEKRNAVRIANELRSKGMECNIETDLYCVIIEIHTVTVFRKNIN